MKILAILIFIADFGFAQITKPAINEFVSTVAYIQDTVGKNIEYGTIFFVANDTGLYIVTAKHVAQTMTEKSSVTIRSKNDLPITVLLKSLVNHPNKVSWTFNDSIDVAAVRIYPSNETLRKTEIKFIHENLLVDSLFVPSRERPVTILGFPLQLGIKRKFSPISMTSLPSSGLLEPGSIYNIKGICFILDNPSVNGFSGAPVLVLPGAYTSGSFQIVDDKQYCVGLITATLFDSTGGKFALVIPSKYIIDTIKMIK